MNSPPQVNGCHLRSGLKSWIMLFWIDVCLSIKEKRSSGRNTFEVNKYLCSAQATTHEKEKQRAEKNWITCVYVQFIPKKFQFFLQPLEKNYTWEKMLEHIENEELLKLCSKKDGVCERNHFFENFELLNIVEFFLFFFDFKEREQ